VTDPGCFSSRPFVRLRSWRRLAVFVPILVAKETVGQLETVSEGVPQLQGIRESAASGSVCGAAIYPCVA
jgi:hypothetical protein